ncbi:hypothetical protein NDS46_16275 [Paenibacillus thiaminolyticus]|uniref:hypothetical protein n=1 Tax=Paenibacillus thiaminolyticus TaxID=49283 RepID=UPI0023305934|nr:hypothetical protein [Paenibacillus thiaminolyticus]WCF05932.1 hypothetical protein NDS46_16275 [Paenibacillus thiaminolyticus]
MKSKKLVVILVLIIAIFSSVCAYIGVASNDGAGEYTFTSIHGEEVTIYGKGIYKNESLSMASQVIAQDYVILVMGIPMLLLSLFFARKSLKGLFMLAGTLGFFLYTYMSYAMTANYNSLFLVYVWLMTLCLVAFIAVCINITGYGLANCFAEKPKLKFAGIFMLVMGVLVAAMWLGRIVPPLLSGTTPESVEHYTTLIIQAMDLGIVIPAMLVAGILTLKRNPIGYFLAVLLSVKTLTLLTSITAMMISMGNNGVPPTAVEIIAFGGFNLVAIVNVVFAVRSVKQPLH